MQDNRPWLRQHADAPRSIDDPGITLHESPMRTVNRAPDKTAWDCMPPSAPAAGPANIPETTLRRETMIPELPPFYAAVESPRAVADGARDAGRPVIGYLCSYAPEKIIHAAGCHPMRLFSSKADIPVLLLEADMVDPRNFSLSQTETRIDAFMEIIKQRS